MNLELTDTVWTLHLERDHDSRDDLVCAFGGLFHVAGNNVYGVPGATLHLIRRVHDFLHEPARVEALRICVIDVN